MQKTVALDKIMAWLASAQPAASAGNLGELVRSLEMLGGLGVTALQRLNILDLFLLRTTHLQAALTSELIAASLPLPADLRLRADRLVDAFGLLARGFVAVFAAMAGSARQTVLHHPAQAIWLDPGTAPPHGTWWLDPTSDQPPHALARRRPPHGSNLFYFDCAPLAHQARMHLAQLADGTPPATFGLPPAAADDYHNILSASASRWSGPGKRQQMRHPGNYRVEICASAGALWDFLSADASTATPATYPLPVSHWLVTNENAGGYALFHVDGLCAGLRTGAALGMRQADASAWSICLVRWAKSDNPAHIELGLELIATTVQAVRLAHRGTPAPVAALLLPAQPALHRGETLLTERGQFKPGIFTLLAEGATGIRLCDCETGQLVTHTSSIEIFEFSRRAPQAAL